jgi:RecA/RadA recombinase
MKKNNFAIHLIQKNDFQLAKEILKPDIIVTTGIKELDKFIGGLKAGEMTYIDGDSKLIKNIPNQICVNTYRTFQKNIIYIDAGTSVNPYKIAEYAKKMEIDQRETLEHIYISRTFTVYQLTTLIQDLLETIIKKRSPQTLIIGKFPMFYLDTDVDEKEARALLRSNLHKIQEITKKHNLITVFTNYDTRLLNTQRNIQRILHNTIDETILMKETELATRVYLLKSKKEAMIMHLPRGQLRLQEFGMVL